METIKLRIIFTCDVHGCFFPYDSFHKRETIGSLSRVYTYVKELRKEYGNNLILLDGGDILQGQPTCYYSNFVAPTTPNLAASIMNYMQYDGVTIGNHDIETGHCVYDKFRRELNCPVLSANITNKETTLPYFLPYSIIKRCEAKIAIVGMTTQSVPYWLNEKLWLNMKFEDTIECANQVLEEIKKSEKPDVIIGLFHTGFNGGLNSVSHSENTTEAIIKNTDGFDLILFGHDHKTFQGIVLDKNGNEVICLNPSSCACFVADAEITIRKTSAKKKKHISDKCQKQAKGTIVSVEKSTADIDFTSRFQKEFNTAENYLDRVIGYIAEPLKLRDCYFGSAPFTDLIHKIQLDVSGADISFAAALAYDEVLKEGPVRVRDIFNLYKYENQIYALKMTGSEIRKYLEKSYDLWIKTMLSPKDHIMKLCRYEYDGKEISFFENLVFNFDTAAGIKYTVNVTEPYGKRVGIISLSNGGIFQENAWYTVAMHSYRGNGGTEFLTKGAGIPYCELKKRTVFISPQNQRVYVIKEFERKKLMHIKKTSNWKFIPEDWAKDAIKRDRKELFGD